YLALSELLARILRTPVFDSPAIDWDALTNELPYTRAVSENSGTVIMEHNGVPYVRMGDRDWIQYRR
ncbi:MAG TPA: cellulose biosynthesis protein BcsG, partial [Burkholderiaceae bacterium]|nr:cellulose biosynthesis protein BcsG [Burkholderiaceae bacterium]